MKLNWTALFIFLLPLVLCGQRETEFRLPKVDLESEDLDVSKLCRPGIINKSRSRGLELSYKFLKGGPLEIGEGELPEQYEDYNRLKAVEAMTFKIKIPVILKKKLKVLLGYSYQPETFSFNRIGPIYSDVLTRVDDVTFKSNGFALYATRPINEKYYAGIRLKTSFNGDYEKLGKIAHRYQTYSVSGLMGVKESDDLEWGLGILFSHNFRNTSLLPFLMYNRNFNDRWGLETMFPAVINGRYNINSKSILIFGTEFNSRSYAFDIGADSNAPAHFHMRHAELQTLLRLERQLIPWLWLNVEGGYQFNFNTEFDDKTTGLNTFKVDPVNNLFFKVGVFLSPPDKMMK